VCLPVHAETFLLPEDVVGFNASIENGKATSAREAGVKIVNIYPRHLYLLSRSGAVNEIRQKDHLLVPRHAPCLHRPGALLQRDLLVIAIHSLSMVELEGAAIIAVGARGRARISITHASVKWANVHATESAGVLDKPQLRKNSRSPGDDTRHLEGQEEDGDQSQRSQAEKRQREREITYPHELPEMELPQIPNLLQGCHSKNSDMYLILNSSVLREQPEHLTICHL
jgi:hypothetical protein